MSQHQHPDEVAPLCGNCGSTMSPRDDNQWFCAGCVEYGRYTGIVSPNRPDHPQFYLDLNNEPERREELLVGNSVEYAPYGTRDPEYVGRIDKVEETGDSPEKLTVFIEKGRDFPFDRIVSEIEYNRFHELLHEPNPPAHSDTIEKDQGVLVLV